MEPALEPEPTVLDPVLKEPTAEPEPETVSKVKEPDMDLEHTDLTKTAEPAVSADEGNIFDRIVRWFASLFG